MLVGRKANSSVETALHISLVGVELEELEPSLGRELGVEGALERILRLLLVVQTLSKLAEDLPLGTSLAVGKVLRLKVGDFGAPDGVDAEVLSRGERVVSCAGIAINERKNVPRREP